MPAKNIECQLAQGQIGRYLAGTDMSAEAISQLEHHIAECVQCSDFVDHRRETLRELAGQQRAAVFAPEPTPIPTTEKASTSANATQALLKAIRDKAVPDTGEEVLATDREPSPRKTTHWKAFGLSIALGLVLLAMSHFTANPTALFGERVALSAVDPPSEPAPAKDDLSRDPFAEVPDDDSTTKTAQGNSASTEPRLPANTSETKLEPSDSAPAPNPDSKIGTPPETKIQVRSRPTGRRKPVQARRPATRPAPRGNSMRVYDENGRLISGA